MQANFHASKFIGVDDFAMQAKNFGVGNFAMSEFFSVDNFAMLANCAPRVQQLSHAPLLNIVIMYVMIVG